MEFSPLAGLGEESAKLRAARREIDPLQSKKDNPVKQAARATAKARKSGRSDSMAGASGKTAVAKMYAKQHGYPNLTKQLGKHQDMLKKFTRTLRKREASQTKAGRKQGMQDLKAKLFKLKLKRTRAARSKSR
jgi:hypothetical protein